MERWERLCRRKQDGGLGFSDLRDFNLALLAKKGWRMVTELDCLMAHVISAKYFEVGNYFFRA